MSDPPKESNTPTASPGPSHWWSDAENAKLTISIAALAISCWSVFFSIYSFEKQFKLDMRPFVGITKVEQITVKNEIQLDATIRNAGKLPANDVALTCSWVIALKQDQKPIFSQNEPEKRFMLFPGAEMKYAVPFQGALQKYLKDPQYEVTLTYSLTYQSAALDDSWRSTHQIRYDAENGVRVMSASGN